MDLTKTELIEAKKMLDDNGISVSAIGSPIGKVKLDYPFKAYLQVFSHAVELADFFGSSYIRIFSYYAPQGKSIDDCRDEVLERITIQAEMLKGSDIVLVHENESHIYGHNAANCADIARSVNSPHLKLVYDPGNFVVANGILNNMDECWPLMEQNIVHIHIKDWTLGSKQQGTMPGEGDGQIRTLLKKLSDIQYTGFLTIEPHLESGGQFGGRSGPYLFGRAISATRRMCDQIALEYC